MKRLIFAIGLVSVLWLGWALAGAVGVAHAASYDTLSIPRANVSAQIEDINSSPSDYGY